MFKSAPLVAVIGSTGVGKSRLSVELATSIRDKLLPVGTSWGHSRIINADAMQTYKGLDLITNKITKAEMNGIEHVLFDIKDLGDEYIVTEWVADAILEINNAHKAQMVPIVVGGTSYWVQHLLFANGLTSLGTDTPATHLDTLPTTHTNVGLEPSLKKLFDNLPARADDVDDEMSFQLHNLLTELDPMTASRWHWRDTRKVLRSLNIIRESGTTVGEAYEVQQDPVPRYPTLILWLYMNTNDLKPMLDQRIDKMVELGLREEIEQTIQLSESNSGRIEMAGLNQAIGYKEFEPYFEDPSRSGLEFDRGVERMKIATRQYAVRQVKWIKSRLLPVAIASPNVHIALLEIKDPGRWDDDILKPALKYLGDFLNGKIDSELYNDSELLKSFIEKADIISVINGRRKVRCDICTTDPRKPVMLDEQTEWEVHKKSRSHRRKASRDVRKEEQLRRQAEIRAQRASARADVLPDA